MWSQSSRPTLNNNDSQYYCQQSIIQQWTNNAAKIYLALVELIIAVSRDSSVERNHIKWCSHVNVTRERNHAYNSCLLLSSVLFHAIAWKASASATNSSNSQSNHKYDAERILTRYMAVRQLAIPRCTRNENVAVCQQQISVKPHLYSCLTIRRGFVVELRRLPKICALCVSLAVPHRPSPLRLAPSAPRPNNVTAMLLGVHRPR